MFDRKTRLARRVLCLDDFEPLARRFLPRPVFGYIAGATERNASLDDNRRVFDEYGFLPRMLRDVSGRDQGVDLLGRRYASPFGIAPMGITSLAGYRADAVQAGCAREAGIPFILSGSALTSLEEIIALNPDAWFQAYLPAEPERRDALVDRVSRAGYRTLVVTVDSAVVPNRENNLRNGFRTPLAPDPALVWQGLTHPRWLVRTMLRTLATQGMPHFENNFAERGAALISRQSVRDFSGREKLCWEDIAAIRSRWRGALVLKGICHPEDARIAREHGSDGLILSNHGGRQLDGTVSPLRMLEAVKAVSGPMAVMIDSGFRRGTDIVKALALGADLAFVGRPFNYASAIGGAAGVAHAIALLRAEIRADMGLLGITRLDELGPQFLLRRA